MPDSRTILGWIHEIFPNTHRQFFVGVMALQKLDMMQKVLLQGNQISFEVMFLLQLLELLEDI